MHKLVSNTKYLFFQSRKFSKQITEVSPLTALSTMDGRYSKACHSLRSYFSEYALMRYRV